MTRETFLKAKRAAAMRYMETAQRDAETASTERQRENARRRYDAGKRTLDAIQNGTFWTAFRESVYASCYAFLPETDIDAVPAV